MSPRQWPNPRDTALDRRSAIARSYRAALLEVAPGRCLALDRAVIEFREASWLMPSRDTTEGLRLSTGEVAELCGVSQSAVRNWAHRDWVPVTRGDDGKFDRDEVLAYRAGQRKLEAAGSSLDP